MGFTVVTVMLAIACYRSHRLTALLSLLGLSLALVALWPASYAGSRQVTPLLVIDSYALLYMGLLLAARIAVLRE